MFIRDNYPAEEQPPTTVVEVCGSSPVGARLGRLSAATKRARVSARAVIGKSVCVSKTRGI